MILSLTPTIIPISSTIPSGFAQDELPSANLTVEMEALPESVQHNDTQSLEEQERMPRQDGFSTRILAANLTAPHNILYGPDGALWITERVAEEVTRINPNTGEELSVITVPESNHTEGQDGLMGMAFDPNFKNTNHIYLAYTYHAKSSNVNTTGSEGEEWNTDRKTNITRYTFDSKANTLGEKTDIIKGLSGSQDHNSGRLIFGPDGKLYYTIGDQGKNQLSLYCSNIEAQHLPTAEQVASQNWDAYEGKVLRLNPDGSIPDDNPVINGVKSHVFTYGHRNHQGIAVGPTGDLYVSEHGDKTDDEVSRLEPGGNFGWPYIAGFKDGKAYQYVNWSAAENCQDLKWNNIAPPPSDLPVMDESQFNTENFVPPVVTFYTVEDDYNFTQPPECGYVCWPTVAPSSLRLYTSDTIPGLENTFLMPTLKAGKIFHIITSENGTAVANEPVELFRSENRYRDVEFSPDGSTIYAITDSFGPVQAINGTVAESLWNPGSVIAFRYEGNGTEGQ